MEEVEALALTFDGIPLSCRDAFTLILAALPTRRDVLQLIATCRALRDAVKLNIGEWDAGRMFRMAPDGAVTEPVAGFHFVVTITGGWAALVHAAAHCPDGGSIFLEEGTYHAVRPPGERYTLRLSRSVAIFGRGRAIITGDFATGGLLNSIAPVAALVGLDIRRGGSDAVHAVCVFAEAGTLRVQDTSLTGPAYGLAYAEGDNTRLQLVRCTMANASCSVAARRGAAIKASHVVITNGGGFAVGFDAQGENSRLEVENCEITTTRICVVFTDGCSGSVRRSLLIGMRPPNGPLEAIGLTVSRCSAGAVVLEQTVFRDCNIGVRAPTRASSDAGTQPVALHLLGGNVFERCHVDRQDHHLQ